MDRQKVRCATLKPVRKAIRLLLLQIRLMLATWVVSLCTTQVAQAEDLAESIPAARYQARVAIIIDDLGYNLDALTALTSTPHALTLAIIPHTPYGKKFAETAHASNKEIMLHTPMETINQSKWERGLRADMEHGELTSTLQGMLNDIPYVRGINNHGGSKLTQNKERMGWLMSVLRERNLYFVDSRTVATTQAQVAAQEAEVANASRDVFLDNQKDVASIQIQLDKLLDIALRDGQAIGIGHPYPETILALEAHLHRFLLKNVEIVSVSEVIFVPEKPQNHIALKSFKIQAKN